MPATTTNILAALCDALNEESMPCALMGELSTILTFTTAPLSYTLRITSGEPTNNIIRVIKDHEGASNDFALTSDENVAELIEWISNQKSKTENEDACGQLKAAPIADSTLLSLLRSEKPKDFEHFAEAERMVNRGCLLDATVELFTPFGLQPTMSGDDSVSFDVKELHTNEMHAGPKIFRLKKYGFESEIRGGLNLAICVTVLYVRSHCSSQAASDRQRRLSSMLKEAGYIDELDDDTLLPQKVLLYDISKLEDRVALVERILLMRDSERKDKAPFGYSRWLGKQKSHYKPVGFAPCPNRRPKAYAYHQRMALDRVSGLRISVRREDIEFGEKEKVVKRSRLPPAGMQNLLELAVWRAQNRVNEALIEERRREAELTPELTQSDDDEETLEPVSPPLSPPSPQSPPKHSFVKRWADMMEEEEEDDIDLVLLGGPIVC